MKHPGITFSTLMIGSVLLLAACSEVGTSPTPENPILLTGQVTDSSGEPVSGAGILIGYQTPLSNRPTTQIAFDIPESGPVKCWIAGECYGDTLRVFWDGPMPAGTFSFPWDSRDREGLTLPSGKYSTNLRYNGEVTTGDLFLFHGEIGPDEDPANYRLQAVTDAQGRFTMDQECLPFGEQVEALNEHGVPLPSWTISREVRFFALHRDHDTAISDWGIADPDTGCQINFTF